MPAYKLIDDHTDLLNKGVKLHTELDAHVVATISVHSFDASGNAPAQSHGNTRHSSTFITQSAVDTHAGLTTGVHGVGVSTIASVQDIATHTSNASAHHSSTSDGLAITPVSITIGADTNLYRGAANQLKTDDGFVCNTLDCGGGYQTFIGDAATGLQFGSGSALDTNLYRGAANQLKTDDGLLVVGGFGCNGAIPQTKAAHITNSAGDDATAVNSILVVLENYGLVATS